MIEKFIAFFVQRELLTNMVFIAILLGGLLAWQEIKKEEQPDVTFDFVRITANYPGATAEEVEHFVTRELEEELSAVDGIYRMYSSVARGTTTISVELEKNYSDKNEVITEIRNAALSTKLPPEVRDKPNVRVFKSSKKAIVDIALINTETHLLNNQQRQELQHYSNLLELQLTNLPQINSVNQSGYLQEELQINVDPKKLVHYQIPLSQVINEVRNNHIRQPAGQIQARNEPNVTIDAQLDSVDKLKRLYIQAGFKGNAITLKDISEVMMDFKREKGITKVNGHEAILLNVVKNSSYDILESLSAVKKIKESFEKNNLQNTSIKLIILNDASYDVRNRLSIIATNGGIGFTLILLTLFLFLDKRSGFWVAMGIPFTVCLTLICVYVIGYTINSITLAAVIIVMGIVVDDAIVVAENIARYRSKGFNPVDAVIKGTSQVFMPVVASIITTCIAFVPLFYFSGHFGSLVSFIPVIIFLMLFASLFESLVILPGHLNSGSYINGRTHEQIFVATKKSHWFDHVEHSYGNFLIHLLNFKFLTLLFFIFILVGALYLAKTSLNFVMFPNVETREVILLGTASKNADQYETSAVSKKIEDIIKPYIGKEIVGYRTDIARSRRGGVTLENSFRIVIEIVPKEERDLSADELVAVWKKQADDIDGLQNLIIQKSRWGQSSGSAVEVLVKENDDKLRGEASEQLAAAMKALPYLKNVEIDRPLTLPEYKVDILRDKVKRLSINPQDISDTFRASLEGNILYELPNGNKHIDVKLSVIDSAKRNIKSILDIPVENRANYLAPLGDLVTIKETLSPISISRRDSQRVNTVIADIKIDATKTPLQIADELEATIFPAIYSKQSSTSLSFDGEIADSRESKNDLVNAIVLVIILIFCVLVILFNSISRPILILLAIPFGGVGVVFAFWLHGQNLFGFFAAVGTLGMIGVVINDAIIMLSMLEQDISSHPARSMNEKIARIAQTRLKAVILTTLTTVAGVLPTAYGLAGFDAMLAEMMLALAWGLVFGTIVTLILIPCLYSFMPPVKRINKNELV